MDAATVTFRDPLNSERPFLTDVGTLRDRFAAAALPALIDANGVTTMRQLARELGQPLEVVVARTAYKYADAMMDERDEVQAD